MEFQYPGPNFEPDRNAFFVFNRYEFGPSNAMALGLLKALGARVPERNALKHCSLTLIDWEVASAPADCAEFEPYIRPHPAKKWARNRQSGASNTELSLDRD
jgi:hypothetical protein